MSQIESTPTPLPSRPTPSAAWSLMASLGFAAAAVGIYLIVRRTKAVESIDHLLDACERAADALDDRLGAQGA